METKEKQETKPKVYQFHVMIVGDHGTGKSSVVDKVGGDVSNNLVLYHFSSIDSSFKTKIFYDRELSRKLSILFWDVGASNNAHAYGRIVGTLLKNLNAVFLLYDISNILSFENVKTYIRVIEESAKRPICAVLCANKNDRLDRAVSTEEGLELAKLYNLPFHEVNCVNGDGIEDATQEMLSMLVNKNYRFGLRFVREKPVNSGGLIKSFGRFLSSKINT